MQQSQQSLIDRLQKPTARVDVVIDTDTYNEIDDQFALAYLIKSSEKLELKAIYAAPFLNEKSISPADGMEKSYLEILRVLALMEREDLVPLVHKGSEWFLPGETEAVVSPAAEHLASLALQYSPDHPLYIVAIAALTNVASALLLKPEIRDNIVIVWLGGHSYDWFDSREFNLRQDVAAARAVFGSGAALVQLPCMGVVSAFATSGPELEHWLRGRNKLCDYLLETTVREAAARQGTALWSRPIWDVCAVAWLLDGRFMRDRLEHSPIPQYDHHYSFDSTRHFIRYVYYISRDRLFADLFAKLAQ